MRLKRISLLLALILAGASLAGSLPAQVLQTPAEKVDFQERGTLYEPMMQYIYDLESRTDRMHVQKFAKTLMGRDVVLCVLSDPPAYQPSDVINTGRPVVLIVNNVHGGEYAGKDATLMLMRDLTLGDLKPLLAKVTVLIVPTINPDGAEVYRRTNEQGFDLNRDYLKLESQEIQGLVTRVINEWHPDIHVDTHHGGAVPYTLTYQTCLNPTCDQDLVDLGNSEIIPRIQSALRQENFDGFFYSGPGVVDGQEGWAPTSCEPRKQHTYSGLSNMVGFLFETPGGTYRIINNGSEVVPVEAKDRYRNQVRGQYLGQREVIRYAAEKGDHLRQVINTAKSRAVKLGSDDSDNDQIVLEYKQESKGDQEVWRAKGWQPRRMERGSQETGFEKIRLPIFTKFTTTRTTVRPWGYLLPPNLATVVPLLLDHQISVLKLTRPAEVEVETYFASEVSDKEYFQGHYLKAAKVTKQTGKVKFPAGSFFVPAGQPKANLISYILEPETDDNLLTWNYLDNYLQVLTPEQRERMQQMRERAGREESRPGQEFPIYRLMKKTELTGVLAEEYNDYRKNSFVR